MRIGYFGDGPWAHKAIEKILKFVEIDFITPRYDRVDPVLKKYADKLGIPFKVEENVNNSSFLDWLRNRNVDLFVSMSFNQILREPILQIPSKGFINCHAGALPFYRGRNPLNWVLINGEDNFGITVHYIDLGIDTGDIIKQKLFPIKKKDDYKTLLEKATLECGILLSEALIEIKLGKVSRKPQSSIHPVGTYFGRRTIGDENISFSLPEEQFLNFVRAITLPGPCARFSLNGQHYGIITAKSIKGSITYIGNLGEVVGRSEKGCIVKVQDKTIMITEVCLIEKDIPSKIFVPHWSIGTRLKSLN